MRIMAKEESEELAVRIITDHLNIEIKNVSPLTQGEDPPDYYFEIGDHKIGCEVIRFSAEGDQFKANGNINIALEQGRKDFRDSGGPALYARFFFDRAAPEKKCQARGLGKKLARIVQIMCDKKIIEIDAGCDDNDILFDEHGLLDYVSTIRVDPVDEEGECWTNVGAGWAASVSAEEVQKIIEGKEKKLSDRRKNYNSVWLVIHNCFEAGFYKIADEAKQFSYKHVFDRIFWIDDLKVYELRRGSGN